MDVIPGFRCAPPWAIFLFSLREKRSAQILLFARPNELALVGSPKAASQDDTLWGS